MSFDVILWVMHNSEETLGRRLVLLALAENANDDGSGAWPSVETLAKKTRLSTRQVKRCLKGLSEDGAIESEGTGPKGTQSWMIVMDKMSPPESPGGDNLSSESGQDVTRTCPIEPVHTPSSPSSGIVCQTCGATCEIDGRCPNEVCEVFRHWKVVMDHPRAILDSARRRVIERALRIATAAECRRAISGCSRSDFHMGRREHKGGTRYDSLGLILRNRDKIEQFMALTPVTADTSSADGFTSSAQDAKIVEHKRNVLRAFDLAGSAEAKRSGDESERWLAQHGIRVVRDDAAARPRFVGPSEPRS